MTHESIQPDAAASDRPARSRDLRRRLFRHYLPIALASTLALVVFMNIAYFDANRYPPPMDIMVEGLSGAIGEQGGNPMGPGMHGGEQNGTNPAAPGGQGGTPDMDHGGAEPAGNSTIPDPGATTTGPTQHSPRMHGQATQGDDQTTAESTEPAAAATTDDSGTRPMQHGAPANGGQSSTPPAAGGDESAIAMDGAPAQGPGDTEHLMRKYSTATGYIALALLALTLLVGPVNLIRRRRTPLSSYLARDIGIIAATMSVAHVIFGFLTQHTDGIVSYFFAPDDRSRILTTSFGLANWTGLVAVIVVAALAAISSDWALRRLKAKRWKRIQRLNYIVFPLVVAHAVFYGALLRLTSPYTALLGVSVVAVLVGQIVGIRLWRKRHAARTSASVPA